MFEEFANVLGKEAINKLGDWLIQKLSGNKKAVEADLIPNRFIHLFEKHGVHRNQITRFFGHGLSLADFANSDVLLAKLTPEILFAASELFAVRMEWLECVDNQIYKIHNFYKHPEDYAEYLAKLVDGRDHQIFAKVVVSTYKRREEDALLILEEHIGEIGDFDVTRYHLCGAWVTKYWKSRADLTACIAITGNQSITLKGRKVSTRINSYCEGKGFIADLYDMPLAFERDRLLRRHYKPWHPDEWLYNPSDYLDGVDEGIFGKVRALERWLYYYDKDNLQTITCRPSNRPAFAALLEKYKQAP